MTTASHTFEIIAAAIERGLQPAGRAQATAATLRQIGSIAGDIPLTLADARIGFERLSIRPVDQTDEPGYITARRKTCGEIAALITSVSLAHGETGDIDGGSVEPLAAVFDAIALAFASSEDPRQRAMAETATREAAELRSPL